MDFFIKPNGKTYLVKDSDGTQHGGPLSFEAAQKKKDALDAAERERLTNDPEAKRTRDLKAAHRVATERRLALTQHMRRQIEENWEGDVAQRLERFDREWAQIAARGSKSDPYVLAALVGTARVPRLRRKIDDAFKSNEEYRKYRESNPQWLGFATMEKALALQKKRRDTNPAAKARRRDGKSTRDQVLALKRAKMSDAKIAKKMDIDVRTVRRHKKADKSSG